MSAGRCIAVRIFLPMSSVWMRAIRRSGEWHFVHKDPQTQAVRVPLPQPGRLIGKRVTARACRAWFAALSLAQLPQFEGPGALFVGSTGVKSAELRIDARGSRV
jgi:hypothetical protein